MAMNRVPSQPKLKWTSPEGWQEVAPGEMRVASFRVRGEGGKEADVSVIPLPGMAGGDLSNVNRWRGQVGLPPVTEEELARLAEKVNVGGHEAGLFDIAGTAASGDKTRILAVVSHQADTAWFIKMTGDDELVAKQKPAFAEFLKTLQFSAGESQAALPADHPPISGDTPALPADHPPIGGGTPDLPKDHPPIGASMPAMPAASGAEPGHPQWTVPTSWKTEPPTQMLLAKFSATDQATRAEITVSSFPGDVGGLLANVNRWRRQVNLPPIEDSQLAQAVREIAVQSDRGSLVELDGTDAKGQPARLIGVAVPHGGQTWFFKMMGDAKVVAREKDAFVKFVQSVKL